MTPRNHDRLSYIIGPVGGLTLPDEARTARGRGETGDRAFTVQTVIMFLMSNDNDRNREDDQTGVVTRTKTRTKKPSLYKVLLLNDDYTPMEFVVHVIERFFNKGREEATRIMLHVHQRGVGVCGVYTYEVAETKVTQVMEFARQHQHPLQCTMEKE